MKKCIKIISIFLMMFMTKNVFAGNLSVSIGCPSTATPNSEVTCSIGASISNSSSPLGGVKGKYSLSNASYVGFSGANGFSGYIDGNGFALTNTNGASNYVVIGSLKVKVGSSGTTNIKIIEIEGSDLDYNDLLVSNASDTISVVAPVTTTTKVQSQTTTKQAQNQVTTKQVQNQTTKQTTTTKVNDAFIDSLIITDHPFNFDKEYFTYNIDVDSDVSSIEIATTFDNTKISVMGDGIKELNYGPNIFEIIATNKSGLKNTYILTVNRKGTNIVSNNTDEIKRAIESYDDITVNVDVNDMNKIVPTEILDLIKGTKKKITYNILESKKLLYSFIFDGKKIKETYNDININIDFDKNNKNIIKKYFEDNKFYILNFNHSGKLPEGTLIKINVNKQFEKDKLYLFYLNDNSNKLELVKNELKVINGYVSFNLSHCSDYVLSDVNVLDKSSNVIILIVGLIVIVLELFGIGFLIKKNQDRKKVEMPI